jgi:acetyltransferase-like isoleucine patch superfamily enzyme
MNHTEATKSSTTLDDLSTTHFLLRLRFARLLAAGSNDLPGWRTVRRTLLRKLLRAPGLSMGSHVRLDRSHPELGGRLSLGVNVDIGPGVILDLSGGVTLEDETSISMGALLLSHDHTIKDAQRPWRSQGKVARPLRICSDSWVGAKAVVLGSATQVDVGAIVGAGATVTKPVPEFAIVVGNPARVVGYRQGRERPRV